MACSPVQAFRGLVLLLLVFAPAAHAQDNSAQRLLLEAERQIQNGNVEEGLAEYAALVERYPQSPLAPQALFQAAWVQYGANLPQQSLATAEALIERYPQSRESAAAFVIQGRIQEELASSPGGLDQARNSFNRVPLLYGSELFPTLESRTEARVRSAEISLLLGDLDEASAGFLEALEDEPSGSSTAAAQLGFGRVLLWRGDWVPAMQVLQKVYSATADDPLRAELNRAARQQMTLGHRIFLRAQAGESPWKSSRPLAFTGLELKRPRWIAADDQGRLLFTDADGVVFVDENGASSRVSQAKNPGRPWFTGSRGYLSLASVFQHAFNRQTTGLTIAGEKPRALDRLIAGAVGLFGEWLALDSRSTDGVARFDRAGRYLGSLTTPGAKVVDLTVTHSGDTLVLDEKNTRWMRYATDGTLVSVHPVRLSRPSSLATDALGNVYVLDSSSRQLVVQDRDGQEIASLGPVLPGGLEPRSLDDVAVDGFGRIFLTNRRDSTVLVVE